jgi:hypothetical protein
MKVAVNNLAAWIGPEYGFVTPRVLVLGESRYDEDFNDREMIEFRVAGNFNRGRRRTFTNFERAVLGHKHSEANACAFWRRTAFYNYNRSFFPGRPRVNLDHRIRSRGQNASCLNKLLREIEPSHVIVCGMGNWDGIGADSPWTRDEMIPGTAEPFCTTTIDGHKILFARLRHPSAAFRSDDWTLMISQFIKLSAADSTDD